VVLGGCDAKGRGWVGYIFFGLTLGWVGFPCVGGSGVCLICLRISRVR
jgi:hypothetical protein